MRSLGDDCLEVSFATTAEAQNCAAALRCGGAFLDVVVGLASVAVRYDAVTTSRSQAEVILNDCLRADVDTAAVVDSELLIPVSYGGVDGPDLESVCTQLQISIADFIVRHTSVAHSVELLGFTPGFAYLSDGAFTHSVARLATPRRRVAEGSIGFVGARTGIYALPGPGGWPLIGRTQRQLFERYESNPFVIRAGMKIRFVSAA